MGSHAPSRAGFRAPRNRTILGAYLVYQQLLTQHPLPSPLALRGGEGGRPEYQGGRAAASPSRRRKREGLRGSTVEIAHHLAPIENCVPTGEGAARDARGRVWSPKRIELFRLRFGF